jgi:hypothetical protein
MSTSVGSVILMNVILGSMNPMIDNWGHLGGALGGAAMAYYFGPRLYLSDLPDGRRIVVDRPIMRFPKEIESLPESMTNGMKRIAGRLHVARFKHDTADNPWRQNERAFRRRSAPNRSIKPSLPPE